MSIYESGVRTLWRNGVAVATDAQSGSFTADRIGFSFDGANLRGIPGSFLHEWWLAPAKPSAGDIDELYADQKAYYGLL